MKLTNPKVLVGSPVSSYKDYSIPDYIKGLKSLSYKNKEIVVLDNSPPEKDLSEKFKFSGIAYERMPHSDNIRQMLVDGRNLLRKKALDEDFDYWLSLEQDVIPPSNIIEALFSSKKEIVTAAYFNFSFEKENPVPQPNAFVLINPSDKKTFITRRLIFEELWPSRLQKIFLSGFGCVLIHKNVLEKIKFRFDKSLSAYDDVFFYRDANLEGFSAYLDSRVICRHMNKMHSNEVLEKTWSK